MKRLKKILFTFSVIIAIVILGLLSWYYYIKTRWHEYWPAPEIMEEAKLVQGAPEPPANFIQLYDSLYPGHRRSTMLDMLLDQSMRGSSAEIRYRSCSCVKLYYLRDSSTSKGWSNQYGFALTEYTSPEKCFDYLVGNMPIWLHGNKFDGLNEVSIHLFNREIKDLTRNETLQLIDIFVGK